MAKRIYFLRNPKSKLDADGQPTNHTWNSPRLADRSIDELIGICKAFTLDGVINEDEVGFLTSWLNTNQHAIDVWPANAIVARINQILADKIIDVEERQDLFELLSGIVGQSKNGAPATNLSTALPLTKPAPPVFFNGQKFCLTGKFIVGPRANVEYEIKERGGIAQTNVTEETNYLVIGTIGSTDWLHSTHGRKIEKAMSVADRGHAIALISEEHWADHLV